MTTLASALISHADLTVSPHRNAAALQQPGALHGFGQTALAILPGLLLTSVVAASAYGLRQLPGMTTFSPMILAILIGIAFHTLVGTPAVARPGVAVSLPAAWPPALVPGTRPGHRRAAPSAVRSSRGVIPNICTDEH